MEGRRFIRTIRLENILSYGPSSEEFPLEPLNVLIGPNASGKSNLIEALSLLAAAPRDIQAPIRTGGGVRHWLWKGTHGPNIATMDAAVEYPQGQQPLRYRLSFTDAESGFWLRDEAIENEKSVIDEKSPFFYYRYRGGNPVLNVLIEEESRRRRRPKDMKHDQSILSQRRDPDSYPELSYLADAFERMRFYREWNFEHGEPPRSPGRTDLPKDGLLEDASNLALVLDDLLNRPPVKREILERLKTFYQSVEDVATAITTGEVQIFFHEEGLQHPVPATRLSDGSLRYLCLLAVLCHPDPPPVVCIEEPEIGLHPDIIPKVAKLLVDASLRSQIFVTTHSDVLVDALTDTPEAIVVCEKSDGATQLHRLDKTELEPWLERYRLGELWTSGEIGGNRW
ncbi:MAG: AAA family ATPase [Nitrospinae bacterium]|nr:AAA family ATPase [Nitrospinota bacterium]